MNKKLHDAFETMFDAGVRVGVESSLDAVPDCPRLRWHKEWDDAMFEALRRMGDSL